MPLILDKKLNAKQIGVDWVVDGTLLNSFKNAPTFKPYPSPIFKTNDSTEWQLICVPNGDYGRFHVYLYASKFALNTKALNVNYSIQIVDISETFHYGVIFTKKKRQFYDNGIDGRKSIYSQLDQIKQVNKLIIRCKIQLMQETMYSMDNNCNAIWDINANVLKRLQSFSALDWFISSMFEINDGTRWYFKLYPNGNARIFVCCHSGFTDLKEEVYCHIIKLNQFNYIHWNLKGIIVRKHVFGPLFGGELPFKFADLKHSNNINIECAVWQKKNSQNEIRRLNHMIISFQKQLIEIKNKQKNDSTNMWQLLVIGYLRKISN